MSLITTEQANQVTKLAVAMFGAAPGGYKEFLDGVHLANGADLVATATAFGNEPAFGAMYNGTAQENADKMIANLSLDKITDTATKDLAKAYITDAVAAGENIATLYGFALNYMANPDAGQDFSEALAVIDNKVAVANSFTAGKGKAVTNLDVLINAIAGVDENTDVDSFVFAELTTDQDTIFGDSGNNTFVAGLSADSDTLQSGDYINGGAGVDTLSVTLADTPYAIIPETESVEIVKVQSQAFGQHQGTNDPSIPVNPMNTIDAQKMIGVEEFWNVSSRADLRIENVQTGSNETTIGIQSTDSGNVDFEVYFNNITKPGDVTEGSQLNIELVDVLGLGKNGEALANLLTTQVLTINIGGQQVEVDLTGDKFKDFTGGTVQSQYQALADFIEGEIGNSNISVELGSAKNAVYSQDADSHSQGDVAGQYFPIIVTNSGPEALTAETWIIGASGTTTDVAKTVENVAPGSIAALTATNIYLDDAGKGSSMGDFVAGNMSTGGHLSNSQGIQQFNIEVDRSSWLNSMDTTNNSLEVMNVKNGDVEGDFRLATMTDVRVFDASTMTGSVTLDEVKLTGAVVAKYMDLKDDATDPSADNSDPVDYVNVVDTEFSYDFGAGDDTMKMFIDGENLAEAGTVTREDFVLEINGGAGADTITTVITGLGANGYANSKENANLTINAGSGDDVISTIGSGDFIINAGSGNDTVYTDNSGGKAAWVVNASNTDSADLLSNGKTLANTVNSFLFGAQLTVTLNDPMNAAAAVAGVTGYESTVTIGTQGFVGNEANINQAIKDAINNDPVLSKLLVAKDGPATTLVISSLIDGTFENDDLDFTIAPAQLAGMSTANQNAIDKAWKTFNGDSTTSITQGDLNTAATAADALYNTSVLDTNAANIGIDSVAFSDNTIDLGTGDDVLVLGTSANSTDTIVFTGSNIGNNTIVNYVEGTDILDFTSYLTDVTSASGSVESQQEVARTSTIEAAATINLTASEVAIVNNFAQNLAENETWANMTAASIDDALTAGVSGNGDVYGNIADGASTVPANLVGTTQTSILMVQNDSNEGEYKVFEVTETTATNAYDVQLLGTVDFGYEITAATLVA